MGRLKIKKKKWTRPETITLRDPHAVHADKSTDRYMTTFLRTLTPEQRDAVEAVTVDLDPDELPIPEPKVQAIVAQLDEHDIPWTARLIENIIMYNYPFTYQVPGPAQGNACPTCGARPVQFCKGADAANCAERVPMTEQEFEAAGGLDTFAASLDSEDLIH